MHMVRMISIATHDYAGHRLHADQEFDCEAQHVSLMQKLGRARPKDDAAANATSAAQPANNYATRDMKAEGRASTARGRRTAKAAA